MGFHIWYTTEIALVGPVEEGEPLEDMYATPDSLKESCYWRRKDGSPLAVIEAEISIHTGQSLDKNITYHLKMNSPF